MASSILSSIELVSAPDIDRITKIDAPKVSTNHDAYIQKNQFGYYILVNTWLMAIRQYSRYGWIRVLDRIKKDGLLSVIASASSSADQLIQGEISDAVFRNVFIDVKRTIQVPHTPINESKEIGHDPTATMLFLLRYPKRLSPLENDLVQKASIQDFLNTENRTKLWQRHEYSLNLINRVREEMSMLLNWEDATDEVIKHMTPEHIVLTSGANFDSGASLGEKLRALSTTEPRYFPRPFGYPIGIFFEGGKMEYWGNNNQYDVRPVDVRAVPKSYKASRIIAMETVRNQGYAKAASLILDRFMPTATPIHDQGVNQELARKGSIDGSLATVDLSHASDTISKVFAFEVFPKRFWGVISQLLGTHTCVDGVTRLMQQMSTAGNALTFQLESLIFLAVAKASCVLYNEFADVPVDPEDVSVYGDDIIIPTEAYETLRDVMSALGFIINESKSFASGSYRESCGAEYWDGIDMSSYYFPRFPIEGKIGSTIEIRLKYRRDSFTGEMADSLTSLVGLQHKLYHVAYDASQFIYMVIKSAFPKMTTSSPDSQNQDCWDYEDTYSIRYAPAAEIIRPEKGKTELKRIKVEGQSRRLKFYPGTKYDLKLSPADQGLAQVMLDLHNYQQFLLHGPRYEDPLLKLLGISAAPTSLEQAFGKLTVNWSLKEVDYE